MKQATDKNEFTLQFIHEFAETFAEACRLTWSAKVTHPNTNSLRIISAVSPHHTITLKFHPSESHLVSIVPVVSVTYGSYQTSVTLPTIFKNVSTKKSIEKLMTLLQLLSQIKTSHNTHD